ncbi:metallophosphoesterase [Massilia sp. R2A-15]|uniref:metallophosphoesterase family protein n=1 Tax=Massilia sp. R2A-15 TaxID=3064278 RepID=UPI0027372C16|nr:metallophosphoesterase [Massilia sp. R2A-15]WLI88557.1 metallophosphoesterase [Massilia sp. R2A-15]
MRALLTVLAACLVSPAASAVTVYAAGDIARCADPDPRWSGAAATAAIISAGLKTDPQARALALGDLAYPHGTLAEFTSCYGPTWGRFKDRTLPAPGNHEYATPRAAGYFAYFGAIAGPGYYRVQLGGWQLYSLDSNLAPAAHRAQTAWLREELAKHPARCTLAYWHHPLYSSGMKGNDARMKDAWQALYEAGAEIVLSGHDHLYERFAPQDADGRRDDARGIRQFVAGTGGAFPTPFLWTRSNSEARDSNHMGVLKLVLNADGYDWEFLAAPNGETGWRPDRGSARCH